MEDRSSPPATTSYYRPPLGVRHLASVSARNVVPPGGPPKRLAGVGVFFTLHECTRDRRKEGAPLYTSEVVRDTLNPDWAPLDEALVDAAAARANAHGEAKYLPPSRRVALHEQMTLRVWFAPAPARFVSSADETNTATRKERTANDEELRASSFVLAFECDVSLGALVPVPGGARGQRLVSLSVSGGRARAGAVLSAPPNTPLLKTRAGFGACASLSLSSFAGSTREKTFSTRHVETSSENDGGGFLNPHDGWVVPRSRAWPALLTAAAVAAARDDADAASTANEKEKEKERLETLDATLETEGSGEPFFAGKARATTRQIRVASEAILDATRRLRVASATAARLKARVAANVERETFRASFSSNKTTPLDPASRAATASANLESFVLKRATLLDTVERARRENDVLATATSTRAAALRRSRDALRGAEARLNDADAIVQGPHGVGRLRSAQRQLVARRWRLVGDIARVFPVTTLNAFGGGARPKEAPADKEKKRDANGDDADATNAREFVSGSGSGSGDESFSETDPSTNRPFRPTSFTSTQPELESLSSLPLAIAGVPLDHTGSLERLKKYGSGAGGLGPLPSVPGANARDFSDAKESLTKKSLTATRTLLDDPECAAAALGYVTQATLQLASVLDVPLRYPVAPGASRSYICDLQQVFAAGEGASGAGDAGDAESSSSRRSDRSIASPEKKSASKTPSLWRRVEFPLFAEPHAAEGTRFAYAVFLLNKDLEQILNAHGMLAVGPRHTLQNLKRLFAARKKVVNLSPGAERVSREEGT